MRVSGPDGREVPSQLTGGKVLFVAKAPSVGYAIYDVQPAETSNTRSSLKVTESSLENDRYRVRLDQNGDVSSIYDKSLNKELLSGPIRLAISTDIPKIYPAWNMEYEQEQAAPRAYVSGPAKIRIKEGGPVRASLEVTRNTEGSNIRSDHQPLFRRRRHSRGIRKRNRLEDSRRQSQSINPPRRVQ